MLPGFVQQSGMFWYLCGFSTLLFLHFPVDIEAQILEIQGMKASLLEEGEQGVGLDSTGFYDQEIYGGSDSRFAGYVTSIAANEQEDVSIVRHWAWIDFFVCICFFISLLSQLDAGCLFVQCTSELF